MAAPTLPEQPQREFDDAAKKYSICIHTQEYPTALTIMKDLYDKMLGWQGEYQKRFHKGYPIHNIGYTLYLQNEHQEAIKYFVLAYTNLFLHLFYIYSINNYIPIQSVRSTGVAWNCCTVFQYAFLLSFTARELA